jgi:hypothetical protein
VLLCAPHWRAPHQKSIILLQSFVVTRFVFSSALLLTNAAPSNKETVRMLYAKGFFHLRKLQSSALFWVILRWILRNTDFSYILFMASNGVHGTGMIKSIRFLSLLVSLHHLKTPNSILVLFKIHLTCQEQSQRALSPLVFTLTTLYSSPRIPLWRLSSAVFLQSVVRLILWVLLNGFGAFTFHGASHHHLCQSISTSLVLRPTWLKVPSMMRIHQLWQPHRIAPGYPLIPLHPWPTRTTPPCKFDKKRPIKVLLAALAGLLMPHGPTLLLSIPFFPCTATNPLRATWKLLAMPSTIFTQRMTMGFPSLPRILRPCITSFITLRQRMSKLTKMPFLPHRSTRQLFSLIVMPAGVSKLVVQWQMGLFFLFSNFKAWVEGLFSRMVALLVGLVTNKRVLRWVPARERFKLPVPLLWRLWIFEIFVGVFLTLAMPSLISMALPYWTMTITHAWDGLTIWLLKRLDILSYARIQYKNGSWTKQSRSNTLPAR